MPSRLDKEQLHGRKTGKSGTNPGRSSTSKNALLTQAHDTSPRNSATSAPKQQIVKERSASLSSDKKQQQQHHQPKTRSKSPPLSSDQPIKSSCMSMNI